MAKNLEDVAALMCLPLYGDSPTIGILLDEKDVKKLEFLSKAYSESKASNESTYATWLRYFNIGKGQNNEYQLEVMLAYWLSWHVLSSCL